MKTRLGAILTALAISLLTPAVPILVGFSGETTPEDRSQLLAIWLGLECFSLLFAFPICLYLLYPRKRHE